MEMKVTAVATVGQEGSLYLCYRNAQPLPLGQEGVSVSLLQGCTASSSSRTGGVSEFLLQGCAASSSSRTGGESLYLCYRNVQPLPLVRPSWKCSHTSPEVCPS